jgi:hypothetical protein
MTMSSSKREIASCALAKSALSSHPWRRVHDAEELPPSWHEFKQAEQTIYWLETSSIGPARGQAPDGPVRMRLELDRPTHEPFGAIHVFRSEMRSIARVLLFRPQS